MAKLHCKYHPKAPARWHCPECAVNVCPQCAKPSGPPRNSMMCHSCGGELDSLGIGNVIPPFWERIPQFFLYPAKFDALAYLGILSLCSLVVFLGIIGVVLYLVIFYALLKYAYLILTHTARGNLVPPEILGPNLAEHNSLPFKQLCVFFLMGVIFSLASHVGGALIGLLVLLFMAFMTPASVMSLAIDGEILKAVNPMHLITFVRRIGWPYIVLYVFLLLLSGGSTIAQELIADLLPLWLLVILGTFVSGYFTVIMFNMMGYVVYQYHEELEFDQVKEYDESGTGVGSAAGAGPGDPLDNEIDILIQEGKFDDAKSRLREHLLRPDSTPAHRERYHKLLLLSRDREESTRHGAEYMRILCAMEQPTKALDVYQDCLSLDPKFRMESGYDTFKFAELAYNTGRRDLALKLLNKFAQRFPHDESIPAAYLLAAKLLCEHKGNDQQALKILEGLSKKFPGHELAGEIESYRQLVAGLGKPAGEAG